jgi:cbb3-type cytochrome oxidase maturation protein
MDILYLLIPASVLLVFCILAVFAWAVQDGQLDSLDQSHAAFADTMPNCFDPRQVR